MANATQQTILHRSSDLIGSLELAAATSTAKVFNLNAYINRHQSAIADVVVESASHLLFSWLPIRISLLL